MSKIDKIIFNDSVIHLNYRHLILTGKNGVGKTRFLNNLLKELKNEKGTELYTKKIVREQISELLKKGISNYPQSLNFKNNEIKKINISQTQYRSEKSYINDLLNTRNLISEKYEYFNKNKKTYLIKSSIDEKNEHLKIKNQNSIPEQYYYYNHPHHIDNFHDSLNSLIENYLTNSKTIEIYPYTNYKNIYYFESSRVSSNLFTMKAFQSFESFKTSQQKHDVEDALEAFLVDQRMAFYDLIKFREPQEHNEISLSARVFDTNEIERWFLKIEKDLQTILENPTIELSFTKTGDQVLIVQKDKNVSFSFDSLSSGFKAIFNIYANLLMRAQFQEIAPEELTGVAIIDEIDVHLHISLQKKVLPFLIKAFPKVQFIVSTHSPFVITSADKNTVVYDISSGDFFEEDLSLYSHESIIKELFHVEVTNEAMANFSDKLVKFIESDESNQNLDEVQTILNEVSKDFDQLSVEAQLQYMVAKNKLSNLKHGGN